MIGTLRTTTVRGVSLAWSELGAGEPLLLLHGLQDSHRTWRRVAPLLARARRVLLLDLPGHGLSACPDAPYTVPWYTRLVADWLAAIGVVRAHVCGHSFGGGIAQWLLLVDRERVDRLALVAPGGLGREVALGLRLAASPPGSWLAPRLLRWGLPLALRLLPGTFGHPEREEIARAVAHCRRPGAARAFHRSLAGVVDGRGQHLLTAARVHEVARLPPIALFWGERDPILPIAHGRAVRARATGVTLTSYPRCGHFPHLDQPAAFARDLLAFLGDADRVTPQVVEG